MASLFELFGEAVPEQPKFQDKKETKKKDTKKKENKSKESGAKKTESSFKSPLSVFIGGYPEPFILTKEGSITVSDVKAFAANTVSGYPTDLTDVLRVKDSAVVYLNGKGLSKGAISVSEGCRMYYGNIEIDISSLVVEDLNLDSDKLDEVVKEMLSAQSISYLYSKEKNLISIQLISSKLEEIPAPKGNIQILLENGEELSVSVLSGQEQLSQISLPGLEQPETNVSEKKKIKVELDKWFKKEGTEMHPHLCLMSSAEKDKYYLGYKISAASGSSAPQETLYETENVVISLLWNRYEVSPECFNGKKQVTVTEILSYLVAQGNREFEWLGKNDVSLQWNSKNRCILVSLKGSRKGADIAPFFLPKKIPFSIAAQWVYFSTLVYDKFHSEVLMDLYYDPKSETYLWYVPKQAVNGASVEALFEPFLQSTMCGLKKIGQFHSHARFPAFFSHKDDDDEIIPGIYGVVGNIRQQLSFKFRLIDLDDNKTEVTFDDLFSDERTVPAEEIAPWINQISPYTLGVFDDTDGEALFPLVIFPHGARGLLLSSTAEADFISHVDGFHVHKICKGHEANFVAISADKEPESDYIVTEQYSGLFLHY